MPLKCDVTGSTDRVHPLPTYMQTEDVKNVCFKVAVQMENERNGVRPADKPKRVEEKPKKATKTSKKKKALK